MRTRTSIVLPVNIALLLIGLADLLSTIFWLRTGRATEVNPIMAGVLSVSPALFVIVKLSTLTAFVAVIEWYRRHRNPVFARIASSFTLLAYLGIYSVSFLAINHDFLLR